MVNLKIRSRLISGFGAITLILALAVGITVANVNTVADLSEPKPGSRRSGRHQQLLIYQYKKCSLFTNHSLKVFALLFTWLSGMNRGF